MIDNEQLAKEVLGHGKQIATIEGSVKSAHHRLDKIDDMVASIHKMTANMESLTNEVKKLGERMENSLKNQGERIGNHELAITAFNKTVETVNALYSRVDVLEKEPGRRYNKFIGYVVAGLVTVLLAYFAGRYL